MIHLCPGTPCGRGTPVGAVFGTGLIVTAVLQFLLLHVVGIGHDAAHEVAERVVAIDINAIEGLNVDVGLGLDHHLGEAVVQVFHRHLSIDERGHGDHLRLVGHVGQGHLRIALHVAERTAQVGGADKGSVLGQHAHQRDAVTVGIHHLNLLRHGAHCSHHGDCNHH